MKDYSCLFVFVIQNSVYLYHTKTDKQRDMKTQKELIEYYTKNLQKVTTSHGFDSDHFYMATFQLKGVQMGMNLPDMFKWARKKMDELHEETLNLL